LNSISLKILELLSTKIEVTRCKNNYKCFISKTCPFCGEVGRRIFRYNTKLKVGKSYCCGNSFKEYNWLKFQLETPNFDKDLFQMENKHAWYENWSDEKISEFKDLIIKDKLSKNESRFEKFIENNDLPF